MMPVMKPLSAACTLRQVVAGSLAVAIVLCQSTSASAQAQPGLEGVWKQVAPHNVLTPQGGGRPPFTADGRQRYEQNRRDAAKRDLSFDQSASACSAPGLPRLMLTSDRFRVFVRPGLVTMTFEWNRLFRQIDLRDVPQKRPEVDTMNGASYGRWDGDTLVVKSLGFLPDKLIDNLVAGSDTLEVVERIRLTDPDTLEDRITITDPATFTAPWDAVVTYKRQPDELFPEISCLDRKSAGQPTWPR